MASLEITLWDEKMRLTSDKDEAFIQQVADYLNEKMNEVVEGDRSLTTKIVLLRTAYYIAAEYLMMKNEMGKLECALEQIEEKLLIAE